MKSVRSTMSFKTGFATVTGGGACAGPPWPKAKLAVASHENRTLETNTDRGKRMRNLLIGIINAALYFQFQHVALCAETRERAFIIAPQYYASPSFWQGAQQWYKGDAPAQ
jgi:hypothetical protein